MYLSKDYTPDETVVIIGRGKKVRAHAGNQRLRQLVQDNLQEYSSSPSKTEKSYIVSRILEEIKDGSTNRLGFVKRDTKGDWFSPQDSVSRIQVAQAFRDSLGGNYYKSSKDSKMKKRLMARDDHHHPPPNGTMNEEEVEVESIGLFGNNDAGGGTLSEPSSNLVSVVRDNLFQDCVHQGRKSAAFSATSSPPLSGDDMLVVPKVIPSSTVSNKDPLGDGQVPQDSYHDYDHHCRRRRQGMAMVPSLNSNNWTSSNSYSFYSTPNIIGDGDNGDNGGLVIMDPTCPNLFNSSSSFQYHNNDTSMLMRKTMIPKLDAFSASEESSYYFLQQKGSVPFPM